MTRKKFIMLLVLAFILIAIAVLSIPNKIESNNLNYSAKESENV